MTKASGRRFLSLWLRRLQTDRIARRDRLLPAPLVVAGTVGNALCLTGLNDAAARLGLGAGMPLADARAMFPTLVVAQADTRADAALLENMAAWCLRYTPLVGIAAPDGLLLDITGCAHLFSGEEGLRRDLLQRLRDFGFHTRAAIADTVGAAHALARHGAHHGRTTIAPAGSVREALHDLPLAGLRLAPETVGGLKQSGFTQIGALYALPRAPLAARFGAGLWLQLDRALGLQGEAITPRHPASRFCVEQPFAEPLVRMEDVLTVVQDLASRLTQLLEQQGVGARGLELLLFRLDGKVQRLTAGTSRPLRDSAFIRRLFADRLTVCEDEYDPGFGYDLVRLGAQETETLDAVQEGLSGGESEAMARLTDRLTARLGAGQVLRLLEQDTHIPEQACMAVPARDAKTFAVPLPLPSQDTLLAARPLRLFARPQALDNAIFDAPDGPPLRFRWRRVLHEVLDSEGPERIAMEWWRDAQGQTLTRDYFRVACKDGGRFWLYREGAAWPSRWFLHGLFA